MAIKDIVFPFDPDSEEDVRVALALYFSDMGFTIEDMSFEDSFQIRIGHTKVDIPKQRIRSHGRSDILLMYGSQPLAIVEMKAPHIVLDEEDRDQALSYARLLHTIAPFSIVSNGRELRVYDTITTELIGSGSPPDSTWWRNGRKLKGITAENRRLASRTLLNISLEVLHEYCTLQTRKGMADLRSSEMISRRYTSALYTRRKNADGVIERFLEDNQLCLAFYGISGSGKSNEICHLAEHISSNSLALFYRAVHLREGLLAAIKEDFSWEFERDESVSRIIHRFAEIAYVHETHFVIFIDGLDEFLGDYRLLRAELIDLAQRLDPDRIRLCVSCKTYDWSFFVKERGYELNSFGATVFPQGTDGNLPGIELAAFSNEELDVAWRKYQEVYHVGSELEGETKALCAVPLNMRLIAEVFAYNDSWIPANLSNITLFEQYWNRRLGEFEPSRQRDATHILCLAAQDMVVEGVSQLREINFFGRHSSGINHEVFDLILRYGLLLRNIQAQEESYLSFPFEKLLLYTYTVKARNWPGISDERSVQEEVERAIETRIGIDALLFFMNVVGETEATWLSNVLRTNVALFLKVAAPRARALRYNRTGKGEDNPVTLNRVQRFIKAYNLLRNAFPILKARLAPYMEGEMGLWRASPFVGFRTKTEAYPQDMVRVEGEPAKSLINWALGGKALPPSIHEDIAPNDPVNNTLLRDIRDTVPELLASNYINKELSSIIRERVLDESPCAVLLAERIHRCLAGRPSIGFEGSPGGSYWVQLGFNSLEDAQAASCQVLLNAANALRDHLIRCASDENEPVMHRWYSSFAEVNALCIHLTQYQRHSDFLPPPPIPVNQLFSYLPDRNLEQALNIVQSITPSVLEEYQKLVLHNFSPISSSFAVFRNLDARIILELSHDRDEAKRWHTDYLYLSYIFLPSHPPGPVSARIVPLHQGVAERLIDRWSARNIFAQDVSVEVEVDGQLVQEPSAIISRVLFPSRETVSDIVYQLIGNECEYVFGDLIEWGTAAESHSFNAKQFVKPFLFYGKLP